MVNEDFLDYKDSSDVAKDADVTAALAGISEKYKKCILVFYTFVVVIVPNLYAKV